MHHRQRLAAVAAAGILLVGGAGFTAPAAAAPAPTPPRAPAATPLVVNARWARHTTFDRVVIDIRGSMPPYTVKPVKTLRYDASGARVPLAGRYFLRIRLSPAAAHDSAGHSVYRGPRLRTLRLPALKGFALTGDFEGVVTFGTAFDSKPSWKAFRLHAPERLVLDIRH